MRAKTIGKTFENTRDRDSRGHGDGSHHQVGFDAKISQVEVFVRRRWAFGRIVVAILFAGLMFGVSENEASAQQFPDLNYFRTAPTYFDADYKDAERSYRRAARNAYRFGNRRFLDSVCYWTMIGECYYHMGNYAEAIEMYEQSLRLYLSHQAENWQQRVTPPPTIQRDVAAFQRAQITWGTPTRRGGIARVPDNFQVLFGQMGNERVLQQGGVVQNPEIKKVDVSEIMRCVALCLHRRRMIKGPTARFDPLTAQLVAGLAGGNAGNGSVLGAYNGVCLGMALSAAEDWEEAARVLKKSVQLSGGLDHSLTPLALLETAHVAFATERDELAATLALEASYSAAVFSQHDQVEEALVLGTVIHLKNNRSVYPPLANAIEWGRRNRARLLQASMIVRLAECYSEAGDPVTSNKILAQAGQAIRPRTTLDQAVVSARLKYITSLNQYLLGDFRRGASSLAAALKHFQTGSVWIYRLSLVDGLVTSGGINARQADQLYGVLLHDPTEIQWQTDPMEAIAFLTTPHVGAMERWFEVVVDRRDYKRAIEISELVRRHRFFATLPLGGRLMAFRWVMQAPELALNQQALKQRAAFLNQNGIYKGAAEQIRQAYVELDKLPLRPEPNSDEEIQQRKLISQIQTLSAAQEAMLASNALRRSPSELVFPPTRKLADLRTAFRDDQFALVTFATFKGYHLFIVNKKAVQYVSFSSGRNVHRQIGSWLRQMGVTEPSIDFKKLTDDEWKQASKDMTAMLFPNAKLSDWDPVNELIVIPDGALWYLPFEALLLGDDQEEKFMSERLHIRYAPTLALAVGAQRETHASKKTGVVVAKMFGRGDNVPATKAFDELQKTFPDASKLENLKTSANVFGGLIDQLIVWSEIRSTKGRPMALAPMQMGTKIDATLAEWIALPWRGPEQIIMPAFQSDGLLMRGKLLGADMFQTSLAMMASGTRSVLISRWSTGGQTSVDLTRQFVELQKEDGTIKALAASRAGVRETELNFENEPRLRTKASDPKTKGEHPFFWASHMLLSVPNEEDLKVTPLGGAAESDDKKLPGGDPKNAGDDKNADPANANPANLDPAKGLGDQGNDSTMKKADPASKGVGEDKKSGDQQTDAKNGVKNVVAPKVEPKKPGGVGWQPRRPPKKADGKSKSGTGGSR